MKLDEVVDKSGCAGSLAEHLAAACSANKVPGAAVALIGEDAVHAVAFGASPAGAPFVPTTRLGMGCVVKPFVATLLGAFAQNGDLALTDEVVRHLELDRAVDVLAGITLRHLLSHTDGLGPRPFDRAPTTPEGWVDVAALTALVCSDESSFPPGQYFTDTHCGFSLLGAVIEKYSGQPFGRTLRRELLDHLAETGSAGPYTEESVCPATGAGLSLSVTECAEFLRFQLNPAAFGAPLFRRIKSFAPFYERQAPYPGWSAGMNGVSLGWKTYAGDWIGHNGIGDAQTVVLRLHPEHKAGVAFLCASNLPVAYACLGRLCGNFLPEFDVKNAPRLLSEEERRNVPTPRRLGTFGNRTRHIAISGDSADRLQITISQLTNGDRKIVASGTLLPATHDLFFIPPPNGGTWFVQYLSSPGATDDDLLWDGWHLWRRRDDRLETRKATPSAA
ncbi:MAG TPA: serine hydrolase domain-containing protein [Gammaproteobacteria bacterium]|nr:serine hydrolase domain-containing protein [Gammaproteobacteria bacterium]